MLNSVQLTVLMGPVIPFPAPKVVLDALDTVTVTTAAGSTSGFQMSFAFTATSELNTLFILAGGSAGVAMPPLRVILTVTLNGNPNVLFDGVMTNVEAQAGQNGGPGQLSVTGEDLTKVMDMIDFSGIPYPAMPIEARVSLICAKYAVFGIAPVPVPVLFQDIPNPVENIPSHKGSDLDYLNQMAEEVGYVFYIDTGPVPGTNFAYFGPEIKVGVPQPALNIDMDAHTNVESMSFSFDPTKGVLPVVYIQNRLTRVPIPIPIPKVNPLQPPLGLLPTPIKNVKVLKDTAKMSPMRAIGRGLAEASRSQDAVSASGSLDVRRYGRLLKARQLVGVRGAGLAYDGLYYVQSVTTTIKRGEITQEFNLTRNGLISILPKVPA
jgi:hypothetical protein